MKSLTPMQAASWVGRQSPQSLGGVAAHLYAEFDGFIHDSARFQQAVNALYARHPMLRLRISDDGKQYVAAEHPPANIDDYRHNTSEYIQNRLAKKRYRMENQQLLRDHGVPCEITLSLLPDGKSRLHIDLDMIAVDADSFRILMEDLARFYASPPNDVIPQHEVAWFHYLEQRLHDPQLQMLKTRDRLWWQDQLPTLPPAPRLFSTEQRCQSRRLALFLDRETSIALNVCARQHHLTLSALFLSLFTLTIGEGLDQPSLRINVPTFFRDPNFPQVEQLVGDFSDFLLFSGEIRPSMSLLHHAQETMAQLHERVSHGNYPGVSIMRDLSRQHGNLQYSPIVFTAGFGIRDGALFSKRVCEQLGTLNWVISQGPQVALDAQVVWYGEEILINWDVRADAFNPGLPEHLFTHFHVLARRLAQHPDHICHPVSQWLANPQEIKHDARYGEESMTKPLTPLQQAYLLGRNSQWPLGGVSMHDFRTFRGSLDPSNFCQRVAELIAHFDALRTVINAEKQQQTVLSVLPSPVERIDLTTCSATEAEQQIQLLKQRYQQHCHDLTLPPWKIVLIAMPTQGEYVVFTSFDALILDGHGISRIIARLFDDQPLEPLVSHQPDQESPGTAHSREVAREWWKATLNDAVTPSRLPWQRPLSEIKCPEWRRESLTLPANSRKKLIRLGAKRGLFANSVMSAVVLDTLALWAEDETLLIGVPCAFSATAEQPTNASTFIAIRYQRSGELEQNAQRLQADIHHGLEHLSWSGVDLARQLSSRNANQPALPLILTNCLSWETLPAESVIREEDGLTQTPQVALDMRLMTDSAGNLRLVADYVVQALSTEMIQAVLETIMRRIQLIVDRESLNIPLREALSYTHYQANTPVTAAVGYDFLGSIAEHLFSGDDTRTALICGDRRWSWKQLGQQVARVANGLLERQLKPGSVVAISLPRSPEHMIISLACALVGIVRVPIDINSPAERTRYLLENCHPDLVISLENAQFDDSVTPHALVSDNDSPPPLTGQSASEQPSYYLYTSGTTGKPKCVMLNNRATANVLAQTIARWQVDERDIFISVTPLHHDMSVFDLFAAMSVGATLVLPTLEQEKDAISWSQLVEQHQVTLWCSVPAILEMLLDCAEPTQLHSLRLVAQGGDYIKPATLRRLLALFPSPRLVSLGGPTETTIWSIWHDITPDDVERVPYGLPLAGNQYYICHNSGEHCPCGVAGRIHTAGVNLACGYLENGEQVDHDFVNILTPEGETVRAFRTGDIGFYRPDGAIMFATRINGYVKIRGIRVSLPEIEDVFRQHPAINDIVVVDYATDDANEKSLGAICLIGDNVMLGITELRTFAQRYLPCTHIPGRFITLQGFPLTTNGKIDRHALRAILTQTPQHTLSVLNTTNCIVRPDVEQKILEIYCAAMQQPVHPEWDATVPFIIMGVKLNHLKTVRERLNAEFGCHLTGHDLIKCKNISDVCALLN
ncbi:amino acid adenylation domain-containing protein [Escherichia coli]|nr:amino acid adenylation domain-containing protein [Escherichia coli]MCN5704607.1 amino acid adenylation domain-containing protein [Escherichia coli]